MAHFYAIIFHLSQKNYKSRIFMEKPIDFTNKIEK